MQNNLLYGCTTTLPNPRGHFYRPRIDRLLGGLLDRHLIAVTAGAGWGKTHAVSMFLNSVPVRVTWFQLSELDNHMTRFWEEFVYIMMSQDKETAALLEQLGFPDTLVKFDKFLHLLAKVVYAREQVVFVFDDFHLIHDSSIQHFVEQLILARLENLCIIINSRENLGMNLTGMITNNLVGLITAEDLHFTPEETEEYLKQNNIILPAQELKRIQDVTEGWTLALYLVAISIKRESKIIKDSISGAIPLIFGMIEKELFCDYAPQIQNFLIRASLLNSFPEGLIKVLADDNINDILEFINANMFIYYNPYTRHYNFHHLFLDFLNGKQRVLTQEEIRNTYLKAARWCVDNDLKLEAFGYYDKCGKYEEILKILRYNPDVATYSKSIAEYYIGILERIPDALVKKHPIVHLFHAGLMFNNARIQEAIQELSDTRREVEALPLTEDNKYVLGNLYFFLGLFSIASGGYDFMELFKKSYEYLPDGGWTDNTGRTVYTQYAIRLSGPAPGEMRKMEEAMLYAIPYASKAMHGYAYGMEYLASAEAAYFVGDMKKAVRNAYEAVYRAREKQVVDIASSGYFLLMRIEAANGNYEGVISHLDQFRTFMSGVEDKINFNGMLDIAEGWFNIITGGTEKIADWIIDDTVAGEVSAPYSMGMERLIKARYWVKLGKYYELLAWQGQSVEFFRQNNMWLNVLDTMIYKAVAFHYIHDEEQSVAALREAYHIAHGNNLVMQFIELGNDMRNVIYAVKNSRINTIPLPWLDEIYTKAATYEKHLRSVKSQYHQTSGAVLKHPVKCTKREKEMLSYLCQGLTNQQIADTCFITVSAVKKMLNNIYMKLEATNRADAVRIAIQMGLSS